MDKPYTFADDNIVDGISENICQGHSNDVINNFVSMLKNAYAERHSVFPLYMENFCHPTLSHIFEIRTGGFKDDINNFVITLENNGFVHSSEMDIGLQKTYSHQKDIGNDHLCMIDSVMKRKRIYQDIVIRINTNNIIECQDLLTTMIRHLQS